MCLPTGQTRRSDDRPGGDIVARSETELREKLSNIRPNQTVFLDASEIRLTESILLDAPGLKLRGRGENRTAVRCSGELVRNAFVVRLQDVARTGGIR